MPRIRTAVLTAALLAATGTASANTYYVRVGGTGVTGLTWVTAFGSLQSALSAAQPGDTIYVAAGTYKPTAIRDAGFSRSATFAPRGNVKIYGGFPAAGGTMAQRNPSANLTILSGDILGNDGANFANTADNVYHVMYLAGNQQGTVIDGLIIQGGNANDSDNFDYGTGAGVLVSGTMTGLPQFRHCVIRSNIANDQGGGAKAFNTVFVFTTFINNWTRQLGEGGGLFGGGNDIYNCKFLGNHANHGGGYQCSGGPWVFGTLFSGNMADAASPDQPGFGGGMYAQTAAGSQIVACTFVGNRATALTGVDQIDGQGGGLALTSGTGLSIQSCIFWDNTRTRVSPFGVVNDQAAQIYQPGGIAGALDWNIVMNLGAGIGTHNLTLNPQFVDANGADNTYGTTDDNPSLGPTSPAVDSGNANAIGTDVYDINENGITNEALPYDVVGNPRSIDLPTIANTGVGGLPVDRGAYETQLPVCYANCDASTTAPVLNVNDFVCFQSRFAANDPWANCDGSTTLPVLNVNDFVCFQSRFAAGCP